MRFDNVIKSFFCVLFVFFTIIEFEGLIFRKIRPNLLYICDYYTIEYVGNQMKLKVAQNYNLIGTVLIVQVIGSDSSTAEVEIEVV